MSRAIIPFLPTQRSGLEELAGGSPAAVNIVVDKLGCIRRRPAIVALPSAPDGVVDADGIEGVFITNAGKLYAVGGSAPSRNVYYVDGGGTFSLSDADGGDLRGFKRPVFAETASILAIAGGDLPQKIVLAENSSSRLLGADYASHVIANSSRLLTNRALSNKGQVPYSGQAAGASYAGFEDWTIQGGGGFFTPEARPDDVVAVAENTNQVFAFGTTSLQTFSPDATDVYAPISAKEHGCIAPYSIVKVEQDFIWLDNMKRVVTSDGRSAEVISGDIQSSLDGIESVSDAFGYRTKLSFVDAYCLCFPSTGMTYVYQKGAGWSTWSGWDIDTNGFSRWAVNALAYHPLTGKAIVGTLDGRLGYLALGQPTDLGGGKIAVSVTTGAQSRGSSARKICKGVELTLRRGETDALDNEPIALLSWSDNGGPWNPPISIGLGMAGDVETVVNLRGLGVYRQRNWRFEFDGDDDIVLVSAYEEFEVLGG